MDLQLRNKRALVSGSTAGIGLAIASVLAREGASIIVNGRSAERVAAAIQKIKADGATGEILACVADLATAQGVDTLTRQFPSLDILVNNLGVYGPKPFEQITDDEWLEIFRINVLSGIRLSRAYLPQMKGQNWGRIVFISSESAVNIPVEMIHYGMTKTAQLAISRGLAETTAGTGVTVNAVMPGPTASEGVNDFVDRLAEGKKVDRGSIEKQFFSEARPSSILQRFATPEEVAAVVAFVCSPLASAINGTSLRADGGVIRSIA